MHMESLCHHHSAAAVLDDPDADAEHCNERSNSVSLLFLNDVIHGQLQYRSTVIVGTHNPASLYFGMSNLFILVKEREKKIY